MTEDRKEDASHDLYLHTDRKIEKVVADVTELMKKDMGLDHKMDMVIQAQSQLKEGFDHSRATGHKTWEAVQKMSAAFESLTSTIKIQEGRIVTNEKLVERVDKRFDKIFIVGGVSIVCGIIMLMMNYLSKGHP